MAKEKVTNPVVVIDKNDDIKTDKGTKTIKRSCSFSLVDRSENGAVKLKAKMLAPIVIDKKGDES